MPFATVRLDLVVSRDQLRTAIGIGHADMGGEPALDELSVRDIRREVEGHLAAGATIELYRETASVVARLAETDGLADIDAAVDRAYTRPPEYPRVPQTPVYGGGRVTLQTEDHGPVTVTEPAWCLGHDAEDVGRRADITHNGREIYAEVETERGTEQLLRSWIVWGPLAVRRPEPLPTVAVDDLPAMEPAQLREFAAELALHADRLYRLAGDLEQIRRAQP
ncbi:hypothetical protein [Streptomyces sp. NPDC002685]|uniref:DUF6907 domain-containing protein n=1 Tax=Streptomyces sp. NPDC002685 TaxID=3154540 RepID=UPI003323A5E8